MLYPLAQIIFTSAALLGSGGVSHQAPRWIDASPVPVNTGQTLLGPGLSDYSTGDGFVVFSTREVHGDLNGDGDTADRVLQSVDLSTGEVRNHAVVTDGGKVLDGAVGFRVREADEGADLNGDGDLLDRIYCRLDLESGEVSSTGITGTHVVTFGDLVAVVFYEAWEGVDINGDGDLGEQVILVADPAAGTSQLLDLAMISLPVGEGAYLAFAVTESVQGDVNGDGDEIDRVVHVYDGVADEVWNTLLPIGGLIPRIEILDSVMALPVSEFMLGVDLNGDGDIVDSVAHLVDLETRTVTNLGLAVQQVVFDFAATYVEGTYLLGVSEAGHGGVDLNGDGDATDVVLHAHDIEEGTTHNTGLAMSDPLFLVNQVDGERLAFRVSEAAQGGADLTGDGDAEDRAVFAYDFRTHTSANFGYPASFGWLGTKTFLRPTGQRVAHVSLEQDTGLDLNGDGDVGQGQSDGEPVLVTLGRQGKLHGTGENSSASFTATATVAEGEWIAFVVSEFYADEDLNRDGDREDQVLHVWNANTSQGWNLGLASSMDIAVEAGHVIVPVEEIDQGQDLNGNGIAFDTVLHLVRFADLPTAPR